MPVQLVSSDQQSSDALCCSETDVVGLGLGIRVRVLELAFRVRFYGLGFRISRSISLLANSAPILLLYTIRHS